MAGPLQGAAPRLVYTVTGRFVRSNACQTLWVEVNRAAHQQINFLVTGKRPANAAIEVSTMRGDASGQHAISTRIPGDGSSVDTAVQHQCPGVHSFGSCMNPGHS